MRTRPESKKVATFCYNCVAGPDLMTVRVEDGVATEVEPNFAAAQFHPAQGKVCVKAYGLIQKAYNPDRVLQPMKRTNPNKGKDQDPGFVPISWDEALDTIAAKVVEARGNAGRDGSGYPRIAASFGGGGTPTYYMGTFPAFLSTLGPIDFGFGSGQGVKCYHSEHLYGEFWHRAFTVASDTPNTNYIVSFGANLEASAGPCGTMRHANARIRGVKRVQIEPHQSVTAGCSAEWVPIKPKTDPAFMLAMIHVLLHGDRSRLDIPYLRDRTGSPYLVAPNGYYLRDPESRKPLIMDSQSQQAVAFDTPGIVPALEGEFIVSGAEIGADDQVWQHHSISVKTAFGHLIDHVEDYTPEWAAAICDVKADTIRRVAEEYLDHAQVGATIDIEGRTLPFRPVSVVLGKTVTNGWGGYECCWGRTMLACLVGALEVPGGILGTTVRLNRPATGRAESIQAGPDGFMAFPMNPTGKDDWKATPHTRNAYDTLVPLASNSPWSQALGPTHLSWMQQNETLDTFPEATLPDVWFIYRTNPAISFWETDTISDIMTRFPFTVGFAYTRDESNHMADILLPDQTDLESTQLIRVGGTKFMEQFWEYQGYILRQPAAEPQGESQDMTWIATELAARCDLLEPYNNAINRGAGGVALKDRGGRYDFSLPTTDKHSVDAIWDASCRAASAELTEGRESDGLDYYKEHGMRMIPFSKLRWYLICEMQDRGLRFEMPYQEGLLRVGRQLANRLHEKGISFWDTQLSEYEALPEWKDVPGIWEDALENNFQIRIGDYPFWLLTSRSMQYNWGSNVAIQMVREVSKNIKGHDGVIMNTQRAAEMGLKEGDWVEIRSPVNVVKGRVGLRQGIRPDVLLMIGQFGHWITPTAKDFQLPSMNPLVPMLMDLTDATGSAADLVRVSIKPLGDAA